MAEDQKRAIFGFWYFLYYLLMFLDVFVFTDIFILFILFRFLYIRSMSLWLVWDREKSTVIQLLEVKQPSNKPSIAGPGFD